MGLDFKNNIKGSATKKVISKIIDSDLIQGFDSLVVGFSGGPDSMCLLHALSQIAPNFNFNLFAVHVNHHLRGKKSDEEEERAIAFCEELDIDCTVYEIDCEEIAKAEKISLEDAGRLARYQIFDEAVDLLIGEEGFEENRVSIVTAHNADDQSETVLHRLIRGTGVSGLTGIHSIRPSEEGNPIIRPLLNVTREEVENYILENDLKPNIDESNFVADATRNNIRLKLIPYLEKNFNPSIKASLRKFSEIADLENQFMEGVTLLFLSEAVSFEEERLAVCIDIEAAKDVHRAILLRAVSNLLKGIILDENVTSEHIQNVTKLLESESPSGRIDLPGEFVAQREYGELLLLPREFAQESKPDESIKLSPTVMLISSFCPVEDEIYAAFDFELFNDIYPGMAGEVKLRTRKEGDFIAIKDGKRKKLQDYLVDSKIKKSDRDSILVAAVENEVLWIPPNSLLPSKAQREKGKFSQNYQITDTTERVLFLEIEDTI